MAKIKKLKMEMIRYKFKTNHVSYSITYEVLYDDKPLCYMFWVILKIT